MIDNDELCEETLPAKQPFLATSFHVGERADR